MYFSKINNMLILINVYMGFHDKFNINTLISFDCAFAYYLINKKDLDNNVIMRLY